MYDRFSDNASRLLSYFVPEPGKTNSRRHTNPPLERILDISRLLRQATTASDQRCSPFFTRLPLEIRSQIYSYVLPPGKRVWLRLSPHQITKSGQGGSLWVEHFPCQRAPKGSILVHTAGYISSTFCGPARTGFFGQLNAGDLQPHSDTLAMIKTCQLMYVDLCGLCRFCFDNVKTLQEISVLYATLPIRHVQMVFYYCLHSNRYTREKIKTRERWMLRVNSSHSYGPCFYRYAGPCQHLNGC